MPVVLTSPNADGVTQILDQESTVIEGLASNEVNRVDIYLLRAGARDRYCGSADVQPDHTWAILVSLVPANHGYIVHVIGDNGHHDTKHAIVLA